MKRCYKCGAEWADKEKPGFNETCEVCQAWWRACKNCRYYDGKLSNHCDLPNTDPPRDAEGKNFCDEFVFADRNDDATEPDSADDVKNRFDSLFD